MNRSQTRGVSPYWFQKCTVEPVTITKDNRGLTTHTCILLSLKMSLSSPETLVPTHKQPCKWPHVHAAMCHLRAQSNNCFAYGALTLILFLCILHLLQCLEVSLLQEPQDSERVNALNKRTQLSKGWDRTSQQFLCSMALGRMLSHHTPSHFDEQRSAAQAEPVHQVRKKLQGVRGRAGTRTQAW